MQKLVRARQLKQGACFLAEKLWRGWGGDSVSKVFAVQTQGPEFGAPTPTLKADSYRRHPTSTSDLYTHAHACLHS